MDLPALQGAWRRHRRSALLAGLFLAATVALALAVPVGAGGEGLAESTQSVSTRAMAAAAEDLDAFLDSKRWGTSLRASRALWQTAADAANDDVQGAGPGAAQFVGFIAAEDRQSAFLVLPSSNVVRVALDAALDDGRVLAAIGDNTVTLRDASGDEEVLALFPLPRPADDS